MSDFSVEMIGDEPGEIERKLGILGTQGQTKANEALVETATEVQEALETTSPVDTGEYQSSWYMLQVAEDEVWILNEADHAKYVMLPNSVMVNSSKADLPASGVLHNVKGVARKYQSDLNSNFANRIQDLIAGVGE